MSRIDRFVPRLRDKELLKKLTRETKPIPEDEALQLVEQAIKNLSGKNPPPENIQIVPLAALPLPKQGELLKNGATLSKRGRMVIIKPRIK